MQIKKDKIRTSAKRNSVLLTAIGFVLWSAFLIDCTHHFSKKKSLATPITSNESLRASTNAADASAATPISSEAAVAAAVDDKPQSSEPNKGESAIEELYRTVSHEHLTRIASEHREHYKNASPFPHIALDNLFPDSLLQKIIAEHPESSLQPNGCVEHASACFNTKWERVKSGIDKEQLMGMHTRILFSFLKSSMFTTFLEELTGIGSILADPHFLGSGLHFTASGGRLDIHADFNKLSAYGLDRRVNLFIYLNKDWPDEYGGHLDLWSRDMKTCYERIAPKLGRFVVFSSTDFSYHGHPEPIAAPQGRARRSMALYYYTNGRPDDECLNNDCTGKTHSTLFQTPVGCEKCLEDACRREGTLDPPTW
eukprot:CAMPEP_0183731986 /NCGR_PEP_ID=MMETSP0737-20130205/37077_1 /TAXON_ID=385413 /ORGANISM="Thalassiosira miniscula, Strain CCMP1093" /LENGTH=367 /DNA_ID=CAMNT_0025964859 /DNA_START=247 /DNA_END=1347 /DNA_ORIENTATION=-